MDVVRARSNNRGAFMKQRHAFLFLCRFLREYLSQKDFFTLLLGCAGDVVVPACLITGVG